MFATNTVGGISKPDVLLIASCYDNFCTGSLFSEEDFHCRDLPTVESRDIDSLDLNFKNEHVYVFESQVNDTLDDEALFLINNNNNHNNKNNCVCFKT